MIFRFSIQGMQCSVCQGHVQKAASRVSGVSGVQVDLVNHLLSLKSEDASCVERVIDAVVAAGYGCVLLDGTGQMPSPEQESRELLRIFLWSLVFALPVCALSMGGMFGVLPGWFAERPWISAWSQLVLVLPVLWLNRGKFARGVKALFRLVPTMESLVTLAAGAGFVYPLVRLANAVFAGGSYAGIMFETPAMLLTLVSLGKWLEGGARGRAAGELQALRERSPRQAIRVTPDGAEEEVPPEQLRRGDRCRVRPGSLIPADGQVVTGHSTVDQSTITGEWMPVEKGPGDEVLGASLNQDGLLEIRVSAAGEESLFGKVIAMVVEAGGSKAPVARLADRVCAVFVPAVLLASLATLLAWLLTGHAWTLALDYAVTVLAISCPCALGLATPVAILVGTGVAARHGILFKNATALEALSRVDTVVLDKTGTLTEGRPALERIVPASPDGDEEGLLEVAASLEQGSQHPLGRALVRRAEELSLELSGVTDFQNHPGRGVTGKIRGRFLGCGNARMLQEAGVELPVEADNAGQSAAATPLYLFSRQELLAVFWMSDTLKPQARETLQDLKASGAACVMLTGDRRQAAQALAKTLPLDQAEGGLLPQDKALWIQNWQREGHSVAMVGDGVNDAPALASARVGVAMGAGTDVALDTADVVLLNLSFSVVATARRLSLATLRVIRENLCWAFCYNVLAIPLAAGLFSRWGVSIPPWTGAAAMSVSSLLVVGNALRLRRFRPKDTPPKEN